MSKTIQCILVDDEPMAREILENHLQKVDAISIIASCKNAIEAFNVISSQQVDLVFLDINMPEISGLSFAKSINKDIKIIFTTAYREYAIDGFDLKAVDYLLKPISFERLLQAIHKFLDENSIIHSNKKEVIAAKENDFIFVRSDRKMVKIYPHTMEYFLIMYFIALKNKINADIAKRYKRLGRMFSGSDDDCLNMNDFMHYITNMPSSILPDYRRKRQYVNSILAKNEIDSNNPYNKKLFIRRVRGCYDLNPYLRFLD